jgi:3-oxoacyl-[acyl-carrier-protein] synthase III
MPDCLIPSTASYICNKLRLPSVVFDVNAACSGFVYGLAVVEGLMKALVTNG